MLNTILKELIQLEEDDYNLEVFLNCIDFFKKHYVGKLDDTNKLFTYIEIENNDIYFETDNIDKIDIQAENGHVRITYKE